MGRRAIAVICSMSMAAILAGGCGGGGSASSSAATAQVKALCPAVLAAKQRYTNATAALSLRFSNLKLVRPARAATEKLRAEAEKLERAVGASDKAKLAPFNLALFKQERVLRAFQAHDPATASKYGNGINAPLAQGLSDLSAICVTAT
jgi:hypothetical protein